MPSKRFKKLPEKTNLLKPLKINELLPLVKKIVQQSLMSQLI